MSNYNELKEFVVYNKLNRFSFSDGSFIC